MWHEKDEKKAATCPVTCVKNAKETFRTGSLLSLGRNRAMTTILADFFFFLQKYYIIKLAAWYLHGSAVFESTNEGAICW
jgi:hypothetical protein